MILHAIRHPAAGQHDCRVKAGNVPQTFFTRISADKIHNFSRAGFFREGMYREISKGLFFNDRFLRKIHTV